ncbi:Na+/H+ antiporter subunit E [Ornithinibacillus gellani]|uniref:Na+/H+ antiporter subunit E n=1 Tax=Ornithinibacillus gellani TaxID=2293253 RepID=UPI000F472390|nr:Na+/H+ antiporter subunit E [Ornithinibacillus gellani]TQS71038.1 Na+/H+ antiporter subunit E [Ornithinibacillus gellani]
MAAQFVLNIFIAFLWMMFRDEDVLRVSTFLTGYAVGIVIVFLMYRFFGKKFYLHRLYAVIKLIFIFNSELFQSAYLVLKTVLTPKLNLQPGIFKYETVLKGEWEVPLLALLLTLTPGSVVMEVAPEGDVFYVHAMDIVKYKENLLRSLGKFEKAIMEVTR